MQSHPNNLLLSIQSQQQVKKAKEKTASFRSFTLERVDSMIQVLQLTSLQAQAGWLKTTLQSLEKIDRNEIIPPFISQWFQSGTEEFIKLYKKFSEQEQKYNVRLFFHYCPPYQKITNDDEEAVKTIFKFKLYSHL